MDDVRDRRFVISLEHSFTVHTVTDLMAKYEHEGLLTNFSIHAVPSKVDNGYLIVFDFTGPETIIKNVERLFGKNKIMY